MVYSFFLYLRLGNPIKALIIVFGLAFSVITIDYVKFPLSIQAGCIALFFIWIGQMIKEYNYIEVVEKVIKNSYYISLFGFLLWGDLFILLLWILECAELVAAQLMCLYLYISV